VILTVSSPDPDAKSAPRADTWPLRGGAACLDFANTVAWRGTSRSVDALRTYDDLIVWFRHAGFLSVLEADRLLRRSAEDQSGSAEVLLRAGELRDAIHNVFVALAHGLDIDERDLAAIKAILAEGVAHFELVRDGTGFALRNPDNGDALALPLWKLAESAARLLISGDWRRVRECPGHECGWLFLDQTKNGNRRWCDSTDCGNRARVRAHYRRRRTEDGGRESEVGSRR
jgi:predicted RNA-binding Zn ribbon-like protein